MPPMMDAAIMAPAGQWANGPPVAARAAAEEWFEVPPPAARAMAEREKEPVADWRRVRLLPKARADIVEHFVYVTVMKHAFRNVASALAFEEQFRRTALLYATKVVFVGGGFDEGGNETRLAFFFAITVGVKQPISAEQRCTWISTKAKRVIDTGAATDEPAELWVVQGPRQFVVQYCPGASIRARLGRQGDTEYVEAVGAPTSGWTTHLLGMPLADVVDTTAKATLGASVRLPFKVLSLAERFRAAGAMAAMVKGTALLAGFDIRLVAAAPWTFAMKSLVSTVKENGKHAVEKVFADVPPRQVRPVEAKTPLDYAKEVETIDPAKVGLVIAASRAMNAQAWADLCTALNADLLYATITTAAISVDVGRVEELDEAEIRGVGRMHAVRAGEHPCSTSAGGQREYGTAPPSTGGAAAPPLPWQTAAAHAGSIFA